MLPDTFCVTCSSEVNLEITQSKVTKATAVEFLCNYYKIDKEKIFAIGDNRNDLEMINYVGHGIAVHNAIPELKEKAEYITDSYDKNGFAKFVNYVLNKVQ